MSHEERAARQREIFDPYHTAISDLLVEALARAAESDAVRVVVLASYNFV